MQSLLILEPLGVEIIPGSTGATKELCYGKIGEIYASRLVLEQTQKNVSRKT